jgi:hypothetical protein
LNDEIHMTEQTLILNGKLFSPRELHVCRFLNTKRSLGQISNSQEARSCLIREYHAITFMMADKLVDKWLSEHTALVKLLYDLPQEIYINSWLTTSCGREESLRRDHANQHRLDVVSDTQSLTQVLQKMAID